jgi:hypothetical protein
MAVCHGDKSEGKINARLVGGQITGDGRVVKTVGSYWPYATTLTGDAVEPAEVADQ